ncbi:hypothetical protein [Teredinibacter sp. KSP-S5-2]|uniref:hypothetical protein n=1 Tax=Teredinibacter sp. KSP-S5-2 TaxID=3034506 RepID=UPI00293456B3|nr:hypothetical protein [Teredinibacter sp. KSP-S5-2]WNO10420.1 hypothetical protein P5V12_04475 [Teredinibacter sp. KSP-S5-2]
MNRDIVNKIEFEKKGLIATIEAINSYAETNFLVKKCKLRLWHLNFMQDLKANLEKQLCMIRDIEDLSLFERTFVIDKSIQFKLFSWSITLRLKMVKAPE